MGVGAGFPRPYVWDPGDEAGKTRPYGGLCGCI
jgi:hypothetical protein